MLCDNKLAAPKCIVLIHTYATTTACFFVLDAGRNAELRTPRKDAVGEVKGAAAARGGEGRGGGRARLARFLFFFSCDRRSQTFWFFLYLLFVFVEDEQKSTGRPCKSLAQSTL
eukprot:SAG22_NODE_9863_length_565_cov_1.708155_1_plen_114_part_00